MNLLINPTTTDNAIQTAIRNADKAEATGYTVTFTGNFHGKDVWAVYKTGSDVQGFGDYYVTAFPEGAVCECEQCKREGYCKHIELCARMEAWIESVEARELEFDTNEEGRFFMEEITAENLAEIAGAWF